VYNSDNWLLNLKITKNNWPNLEVGSSYL